MSPKRVNQQEKRLSIAEAALRVFSRNGFQKTRIQEIADEAGIGKGTIYEYFNGKEEIVHELFEHKFTQMIAREQRTERPTPLAALLASIQESFSLAEKNRDLNTLWFEVLSSKVIDNVDPINNRMRTLFDGLRNLYVQRISEGQETGHIRTDIDAEACAGSIVAALDGIVLHATLFPTDVEEKERRYQEFVRMTEAYLKTTESTSATKERR